MNNANFFPFERNRYFYGKLLTVRDFEVEQRYHCTKRELLNRLVHGAGVVCGLGVTASDESTLMIESGMALDYQGREIVLPEALFRKLQMLEGQETLELGSDGMAVYHAGDEEPARYPVGNIITGTVTNVTDFGLFVEVEEGIEGLIHVTELGKKVKSPSELYKEGDTVQAKIIHVSADERRLGLSIKQIKDDEERRKPKDYHSGDNSISQTLGDLLKQKFND